MEPNYTLTLTQAEIQIIAAGLSELPYKVSAALLANIQGQVNAIAAAAKGQETATG